MNAQARRMADVSWLARLRRWVEDTLPWYSPEAEREHRAYTADLEERATRSIRSADTVRRAYLESARATPAPFGRHRR